MNALQSFQFKSHQLRIEQDENGGVLFHANDLCAILSYANPWDALSRHVDDEDLVKREALTAGGKQLVNFVREPGMWSLVMGSNTAFAKPVKRWVTAEVLPNLRKTGSYGIPHELQQQITHLQAELLKSRPRMHDVLKLTRCGYSRKAQAKMLGIGETTVRVEAQKLKDCGYDLQAAGTQMTVAGGNL